MNPTPPPLAQHAAQTPQGPGAEAPRTMHSRTLAVLFALVDAQLAALFAALENLLARWRAGTLPPPPPARPHQPRRNQPISLPPRPAGAEGWFTHLIHRTPPFPHPTQALEIRPPPITTPQHTGNFSCITGEF